MFVWMVPQFFIPMYIVKYVAIPLRLVSEVDARKKKLMGLHDSIAELKASYDANKSLKLLDSIIVYFHDCNVYMISHVCLSCQVGSNQDFAGQLQKG